MTDKSDDIQDLVRVLLLSATPYKMYSTPEEIEDTGNESSYTPKPFDRVLGWDNDENESYPDIFFEWVEDSNYHYRCARGGYKHVKPYKE